MTEETPAAATAIDLGVNLEPAAPKPARKKVAAIGLPDTVRILVEENDEIPPTGLFVGLNGTGYLIRAGEPVDVPRAILGVLDCAVMSAPQIDPTTRQVVGYRERMRYPYRTLKPLDTAV